MITELEYPHEKSCDKSMVECRTYSRLRCRLYHGLKSCPIGALQLPVEFQISMVYDVQYMSHTAHNDPTPNHRDRGHDHFSVHMFEIAFVTSSRNIVVVKNLLTCLLQRATPKYSLITQFLNNIMQKCNNTLLLSHSLSKIQKLSLIYIFVLNNCILI